jgi:hypothetical protein
MHHAPALSGRRFTGSVQHIVPEHKDLFVVHYPLHSARPWKDSAVKEREDGWKNKACLAANGTWKMGVFWD